MEKFDEYLVAYIDFLGTTEKIKTDNENSHFEKIEKIYNFARENIEDFYNKHYAETIDSKIQIKMFSDNIIFCLKCNGNINKELEVITKFTCAYQSKALSMKLLTRGGIAKGEFYINELFVYGKALLEAVELEKNAIYPRTILSPKIKNIANNSILWVSKDNDGLFFVDYMEPLWQIIMLDNEDFDSPGTTLTKNRLLKVKKLIVDFYSNEASTDVKILQKWQWLINQYNNYCKKIENKEIVEDVEKNILFEGLKIRKDDLKIICSNP